MQHNPRRGTSSLSIEIRPAVQMRLRRTAAPPSAYTSSSHWILRKGISPRSQADVEVGREPCEPQTDSRFRDGLYEHAEDKQRSGNCATLPIEIMECCCSSAWQVSFFFLSKDNWMQVIDRINGRIATIILNCLFALTHNLTFEQAVYSEMLFCSLSGTNNHTAKPLQSPLLSIQMLTLNSSKPFVSKCNPKTIVLFKIFPNVETTLAEYLGGQSRNS